MLYSGMLSAQFDNRNEKEIHVDIEYDTGITTNERMEDIKYVDILSVNPSWILSIYSEEELIKIIKSDLTEGI